MEWSPDTSSFAVESMHARLPPPPLPILSCIDNHCKRSYQLNRRTGLLVSTYLKKLAGVFQVTGR